MLPSLQPKCVDRGMEYGSDGVQLQGHDFRAGDCHFQSSHARWLALTHRTSSSHFSFLYGVKSTRIYCRPTCTARLARRSNVVFYDTEAEARRDGFRPCKRCKPDDVTFLGDGEEVVMKMLALLRIKNDEGEMRGGVKELAKEVGVTPSYLCRVFKKTMGVTIGTYIREFENDVIGSSPETATVNTAIPDALYAEKWSPLPGDGSKTKQVGGESEQVEASDEDFDLDEWINL